MNIIRNILRVIIALAFTPFLPIIAVLVWVLSNEKYTEILKDGIKTFWVYK